VVALGPVVARARILVHEVPREEELAKRRRAHNANDAGLEVEERRAGHVLAALGLEVKHADAVELRVIVTAVLAVVDDAGLAEHHHFFFLPIWLPH
jgi:hypothetical protein